MKRNILGSNLLHLNEVIHKTLNTNGVNEIEWISDFS